MKSSDTHVHIVSPEHLPLSCPTSETTIWDKHPRIYLPITKTGSITCPYCGAHYSLAKN